MDLTFYAKGLTSKNRNVIQGAILIALDTAVGEFNVETKIGRIELKSAPRNTVKAGLKAFHELLAVVREWVPSISPLNVFLCYASEDKPVVNALYRHLVADGYHPWFDNESICPAKIGNVKSRKALNRSDVVLVCLSSNSINKTGYVQKEIKEVLDAAELRPEGAIFVIPVKLEDCVVPDRLAKWQWVNLFERNGYKQLVLALRVHASTRIHR